MVTESLYFWIIRSGYLLIKVQTLEDDQIVLEDHCDFIIKILRYILEHCLQNVQNKYFRVILHSNIKTLHQNFTIDLRNFQNFHVNEDIGDSLEEFGIKV